ncbi:efflux RND transporter periplasmic adaptor subunit [bacterium]|nr:efflux RND transporter periplasmic adaptor subunit [bacterium]
MRLSKYILLGLLACGCQGSPKTEGTAAPSATPLVVTQTVKASTRKGGERFSATVQPDTRVTLTFNSGGYVTRIQQRPGKGGEHILGAGDRVRRGEVLAELRTLEYRARVNEAESSLGQSLAGEHDALASVELARAQTRQSRALVDQALQAEVQSKAQVREAEAGLRAVQAQLGEAQAQLGKSQADWERAQNLMQANSLTQPDYDAARLAFSVAQGKLKEAQQQVRSTEAKLTEARAGVSAARARVEQAQAQMDAGRAQEDRALAGVESARARTLGARSNVEQASVALGDVYLKAPMDGVILSRSVEVGAQVGPGTAGFALADTHHVLVTFGVPDILVRDLKLGQTLNITSEALPGNQFQGTIRTIAPEADADSRVYKVEVRVDNSGDNLKVGMIAALDLVDKEDSPRSIIAVPLGALLPNKDQEGSYQVFVVEGDKARLRDVSVGRASGDQMEITAGLEEGEQIVVEGGNRVNNGQTVKVKS